MVDACSGRSRISELLDRACCVARAGFGQLDSGADGESEGNSPAGYIETGTSKPARIEGASYRAGLGKPHAHRKHRKPPEFTECEDNDVPTCWVPHFIPEATKP